MELEQLCSLWGIKILRSSTKRRIVFASMPIAMFQRMMMQKPVQGDIKVPGVLSTFLERIVIGNVNTISTKKTRQSLERKKR